MVVKTFWTDSVRFQFGLDVFDDPIRRVERPARIGLHNDIELGLVGLGKELCAEETGEEKARSQENDTQNHDGPSMSEGPGKQAAVAQVQSVQPALDHTIYTAVSFRGRKKLRGQHGCQGERHEKGNQHRGGDRDPELIEETSDQTFHEGHGNENGYDGESGRHDREPDLGSREWPRLPCGIFPLPCGGRCSR